MQGYGNPYGRPRDDRRDPQYDSRSHDNYGSRGGANGYSGAGGDRGGYGNRDDRGGGGYGGGRGRSRYEDDDRDAKRGRYEDYDRSRGDGHSSFAPSHAGLSQQQQQHAYGAPSGHSPYGQPAYAQHQAQPAATADPGAPPARKPVQPEAPSASVILLGLPAHVNDTLLRQFLEDMGASIDSTTVIMDRQTGLSKRFGFAKFSSVEHARSFIEPNFPSIPWRERGGPGPDDGMRIKVNYSQKSGGWREDQGAAARLTEDQRKAEGSTDLSFYVNDGTRDVGATPSQILLLRGLDPLTNEEEIVSALSRVGGRANTEIAKGGIKKVYIAKDRASRSSWGFAFVQFSDVRLATDVLGAVLNPRFHPTGFRIRNAVAAVSFKHENSFIPVYAATNWAFDSDGGQKLAYWDDKGFVQPWTPPPPPKFDNVPKAPRAVEEARVDADLADFFDSLGEAPAEPTPADNVPPSSAVIAALPTPAVIAAPPTPAVPSFPPTPASSAVPSRPSPSATPTTLPPPGAVAPISIKPIAALPGATAAASPAKPVSVAGPSPAAAASPAVAAPLGAKEKKGDLIVSRKAAGSIAKWNTKAKELRAVPPAATPAAAPAPATQAPPGQGASPNTPSLSTPAASPAAGAATPASLFDDPEFAHTDPVSFVCWLCQRQLKTLEQLKKHNQQSKLHKATRPHTRTFLSSRLTDNLANPTAVATAATKVAEARKKHAAASPAPSASADSKPKYVDRAAARREALGQSDHPDAKGANGGRKKIEGPEPPAKVGEAPNKDGLEESNAGRKMLEKMGWSSGTGLGASGDGRVEAVQATQFQQRAGLGSSKGTVVGKSEDEKLTYAERQRAKALERYNEA
ncbi:hypothetical protein JCM10213v2_004680 [Rhodosporidiobolus nylandii]